MGGLAVVVSDKAGREFERTTEWHTVGLLRGLSDRAVPQRIGLAFIAIWTYLARVPALLAHGMGADAALRARRAATVGPVVYALTIPLAFVSPVACLIVYAALALYFAIVFTVGGRQEGIRDGR